MHGTIAEITPVLIRNSITTGDIQHDVRWMSRIGAKMRLILELIELVLTPR